MNKIKPFFNGNKNEDFPVFRNHKDFLNKSIDSDVLKAFKEFRLSSVAQNNCSPFGQNGSPSILNSTIDDFIEIHEYIDKKRKDWLEEFRKIDEQAKERHLYIRQTMADFRDNYERAQRKFEAADGNLKKFRSRSDSGAVPNYDERCRELEDIRGECDQARILHRDNYITETNREAQASPVSVAPPPLSYHDIEQYLSYRIPEIKNRLDTNKLAPSFYCDLSEHCLKRIQRPIAYPIEFCIHLLKDSLQEEGLFRIAPAQIKQKKLMTELDLQLIDKNSRLEDFGYDAHVPASTLKQYLRGLPDCLLTNALIPDWNKIPLLSTEADRVQRIGQLINQLPKVNYDNLRYLIRFLSDVARHSSVNKMTASNLSICIGSNLYPKEQSSNFSTPNLYANSSIIVELMIIHYETLFSSNNQIDIEQENLSSYNYLIRFLSDVARHSSVNKMTASNLSICIGSNLYPKEQSSNFSTPNLYANSSIIVELMIIHYETLFSSNNQIDIEQENLSSYKFQPKTLTTSNETLFDNQSNTGLIQSSPRVNKKNRHLLTTEDSLIDKIHSKQRTVSSSSSSNSNEKTHRRNENVAIVLDCSNSASLVPQQRQRHLNNIKEPDISQSKEENKITSHDNIHSTEINSDTNSSQTSSSGVSSHHDNTKTSS
ncbi:unnamed protein product [Rotaria socialis]|uniref:Rho-GAP domain-containing protein n=2 Tax=Rotaria socialis TaxID=392032 RepID=A0A818X6D6_9BILA|nr:unnamed protein product [Rotaria socialis]